MSGNTPEDDVPGGAAALGGSATGAPRPGGAGHLDDGVPAPGEAGGIPRPLPVAPPGPPAGRPLPLGAALREAVLAALVALGLFVPLVGLRTEPGDGGLVLRTRWADVAILVALTFAGRFLLALWHRRQRHSAARRAWSPRPPSWIGRVVAPLLLLLGVALPFLPGVGRYELDLAVLVATYVMLGWGLNIVVGLAGLLDLGYVAFYAVGAYAYALLALNFGLSFWICLPLAGILAAFWGVILGFPVLRLRGDYLAIVTLAFGEIIRIVLINWVSLTGGPNGLSGIPRPSFFGLEFGMGGGPDTFAGYFGLTPSPLHRVIFLYYLILALALLTNWVTLRLRRQPLGRAWEALREDEIAARALGINITTTKLTAFALGAMFGGFAGAFFATRQAFISPESFTFIESAIILAIVVLGGLGSQLGVAIAALVMIGGFEVFRDLQEWRMLVFGIAMVTIMVWRPRGLVSTRRPTVSLGKARAISGDLVGEGRG